MERLVTITTATASRIRLDTLLKSFLVLVLFLLPFQEFLKPLVIGGRSLSWISHLDEGSFLLTAFLLATFIFLSPTGYRIRPIPTTPYILLFVIIGFASLVINQVPLVQGLFGIYDVLKNVLVLYAFAHLHFSRKDLLTLIRALLTMAVGLGLLAVAGEVAACVWDRGIGYYVTYEKRMGLYRVNSITGNSSYNYLGIYMVLMFYLALALHEPLRKKGATLMMTLITIVLTFSRQAYVGFGLMGCLIKKRLIPLALPAVGLAAWMLISQIKEFNPAFYYRGFGFIESCRLFNQHPVWGVGPGMFGSLGATLFGSPYYEHWPKVYMQMMQETRNIDLFWPSLAAEFGACGLLAYLLFFIALFLHLRTLARRCRAAQDGQMHDLGMILCYFILALIVMGCAGGLNCAFVAYTFFALVGMYISACHDPQPVPESLSQ